MKKFLSAAWEVIEILIVASASILIIYRFIAHPFLVQGASMEPNFSNGNYLIVDELTYRFREPQRGEVIVFKNPTNESEFYIKRIIGLPGETVVVRNSEVSIGGEKLKESYLPAGVRFNNDVSIELGDGQYFVMGDNRTQSFDSRNWGPLDRQKIIGTVRFRLWPLNDLDFFYEPSPQNK